MNKCIGQIEVDLYGDEEIGPVNMSISNNEDCLKDDNEVWFRQRDIPYLIEELKKHLIED